MEPVTIKDIAEKYKMDYNSTARKLRKCGIKKIGTQQKGKVFVGLYDADEISSAFAQGKRANKPSKPITPRFASFEESVLANRGAGLKAGAIAKRLKANIVDVWNVISKAAAFDTSHSV